MKNVRIFAILLTSLWTVSSHCMLRLYRATQLSSNGKRCGFPTYHSHTSRHNKILARPFKKRPATRHLGLCQGKKTIQRKIKQKRTPANSRPGRSECEKCYVIGKVVRDTRKGIFYAHTLPAAFGLLFVWAGLMGSGANMLFFGLGDSGFLTSSLEVFSNGIKLLVPTTISAAVVCPNKEEQLKKIKDYYLNQYKKKSKEPK